MLTQSPHFLSTRLELGSGPGLGLVKVNVAVYTFELSNLRIIDAQLDQQKHSKLVKKNSV